MKKIKTKETYNDTPLETLPLFWRYLKAMCTGPPFTAMALTKTSSSSCSLAEDFSGLFSSAS